MSRFHITLVRPDGYLHTEAFREIAETLQCGLQGLGHTAHIQENAVDAIATNVLLGAHLLTPDEASIVPPGSIVYNLEQLGGPSLPKHFYDLGGPQVRAPAHPCSLGICAGTKAHPGVESPKHRRPFLRLVE